MFCFYYLVVLMIFFVFSREIFLVKRFFFGIGRWEVVIKVWFVLRLEKVFGEVE